MIGGTKVEATLGRDVFSSSIFWYVAEREPLLQLWMRCLFSPLKRAGEADLQALRGISLDDQNYNFHPLKINTHSLLDV
jgi:hypothetical protein